LTVTDVPGTTNEESLSPRLQQFQAEVEQLKVTGGKANPERVWMGLAIAAMIAGVALSLVGWLSTQGTSNPSEFADYSAMGRFGLALTLAGAAVFVVMSLRRYFRYWLVRLIYEHRDQIDRLIKSK
jgi:hypothetical protein